MAATFLWYDLETFGKNPRWDRIAQFAAIRTTTDFEPVGEPVVLYCRISPDYLPDPHACLITGITPKKTGEAGMREADFAAELYREMTVPDTCVVGYNNLQFDDEFVRNLFYRNFFDPYRREYAAGNSRWDVLGLVRMAHDLRPEGIQWLSDDEGKPVFKLERLSEANGIEHESAHDALSDTRATMELAKLIREKQPDLFDYYYKLRKKEAARRMINLESFDPVVYTSRLFTRPGAASSIVAPITTDPENFNAVYAFDLRSDPAPLLEYDVDTIRRLVFTRSDRLAPEQERIPLVSIALNRSPALSPLSVLDDARQKSLGLDTHQALENHKRIIESEGLARKVREVFRKDLSRMPQYQDPDLQIYQGSFFGDEDKAAFADIRRKSPQELIDHPPHLRDPRGPRLLQRYLGRNYYDFLSEQEQQRWHNICAARLLAPEFEQAYEFGKFRKKVMSMLYDSNIGARDKLILKDLLDYADWLKENIL
ncbi:MAG: exodeoxyribonuclease I [Spirochaetales bacterium]|nr:exodeoxyribonuclease I [Spirochaetales bacterium]MCF7937689.1 exodeoxyribonuclease I [Spirochaetales bacterium]